MMDEPNYQQEINKLNSDYDDRMKVVGKHLSNIDSAIEHFFNAYDDDVITVDTFLVKQLLVISENYMALTDHERYSLINDGDDAPYSYKYAFLKLCDFWVSYLDDRHSLDFPETHKSKIKDALQLFVIDANISNSIIIAHHWWFEELMISRFKSAIANQFSF